MAVIISMLRGVNLAGHRNIKMDALRSLYESLRLRDAQTHVRSGNVVFRTAERDLVRVTRRIQKGIEQSVGFQCNVIVRTVPELRDVIARNPFAKRHGIEPSRLLVTFLATDPDAEARKRILTIETAPEELRIEGRELYIYYPNGMARPKLSWPMIEKILKTSGTGRNWNTVTKLLHMAEKLESLE